MTDSQASPSARAGKRERLIDGARSVFYEQGIERATLAVIAEAAGVPAGNVYYYFKTKDELVEAAIDSYKSEIKEQLEALEKHRTPKARLKAFVRMLGGQADTTARHGCPHGSMCSELDKCEGELSGACAEMLRLPVDWAERQFREMGRRDARELAFALIASYQGIALLTNTFRDPNLMARETKRLDRWIDSL
jgi:TetR/AcrR family transcriptional regulator, transcriptional repressor for nem operon